MKNDVWHYTMTCRAKWNKSKNRERDGKYLMSHHGQQTILNLGHVYYQTMLVTSVSQMKRVFAVWCFLPAAVNPRTTPPCEVSAIPQTFCKSLLAKRWPLISYIGFYTPQLFRWTFCTTEVGILVSMQAKFSALLVQFQHFTSAGQLAFTHVLSYVCQLLQIQDVRSNITLSQHLITPILTNPTGETDNNAFNHQNQYKCSFRFPAATPRNHLVLT